MLSLLIGLIWFPGAVAFLPLELIIPFVLANRALRLPLWRRIIHNILASIFAFIGMLGFVSADSGLALPIATVQAAVIKKMSSMHNTSASIPAEFFTNSSGQCCKHPACLLACKSASLNETLLLSGLSFGHKSRSCPLQDVWEQLQR